MRRAIRLLAMDKEQRSGDSLLVMISLIGVLLLSEVICSWAFREFDEEDLSLLVILPVFLMYFSFGGIVGGVIGHLSSGTRAGFFSGILIGGMLLWFLVCTAALA